MTVGELHQLFHTPWPLSHTTLVNKIECPCSQNKITAFLEVKLF